MCLGIPGELVGMIDGYEGLAVVRVEGVERPVNMGLLADEVLVPGDWVLIHLGFALQRIDEGVAKASLAFVTGAADMPDPPDPSPQ